MTEKSDYSPPKVWVWDKEKDSAGRFSAINKPTAGSTHYKQLPVGKHPHQLYSLATPNGVKVTVMFEELLALGKENAEYDAWLVDIGSGEQFSSGFVEANPNSKIPALVDHSFASPFRVFESGAILLHLAEKFNELIPTSLPDKAECLSWLFWQMASTPYLGGGFGHFYAYAPEKYEYPINRYTMEVKRQLDVLDQHLESREYFCGNNYTIADIAIHAWYGNLVLGSQYDAQEFLSVDSYEHVQRWASYIQKRPAVRRGQRVNKVWGKEEKQIRERHDAKDIS